MNDPYIISTANEHDALFIVFALQSGFEEFTVEYHGHTMAIITKLGTICTWRIQGFPYAFTRLTKTKVWDYIHKDGASKWIFND